MRPPLTRSRTPRRRECANRHRAQEAWPLAPQAEKRSLHPDFGGTAPHWREALSGPGRSSVLHGPCYNRGSELTAQLRRIYGGITRSSFARKFFPPQQSRARAFLILEREVARDPTGRSRMPFRTLTKGEAEKGRCSRGRAFPRVYIFPPLLTSTPWRSHGRKPNIT